MLIIIHLPFTSSSLRCSAAVNDISQGSRILINWTFHVVEGSVEGQTRAHPKKHVSAQFISRRPEIVFCIAYTVLKCTQNFSSIYKLTNSIKLR